MNGISLAKQEWVEAWPQPIIGMLGVVTAATFVYASGVFMARMTADFHWTRTQFSSAFAMQMLVGLVVGPLIGRLVDRVGPREVALAGCFTFFAGMSLLGVADGSIAQWRLLCIVEGIGAAALSTTVWVTAVSGRFTASRGLALAVVLAGTGMAAAIWPIVTVYYIEWFGWRAAFPALAGTGVAVVLPLTWLFFRNPVPVSRGVGARPQPKLVSIVASRTFLCILFAGMLFAALTVGLIVDLVPILIDNGFALRAAAGIASFAGIGTLLGRGAIGYALDRFPTRVVGVCAFLTPLPTIALLWLGRGSLPLSAAGAAVLGFTTGAESDVLAYLASRRIDRRIFASGYALIIAAYSFTASLGPLAASSLYDAAHSYSLFLLACVPVAIVSTLLIWLVPAAGSDHADLVA